MELSEPLTWNGAMAILRRERAPLYRTQMIRPAALIDGLGVRVVMLDTSTPGRRQLPSLAHEIAHIALDCDGGDGDPVYHLSDGWPDDAREDDADVLAMFLLYGPEFSRHFHREPPTGGS